MVKEKVITGKVKFKDVKKNGAYSLKVCISPEDSSTLKAITESVNDAITIGKAKYGELWEEYYKPFSMCIEEDGRLSISCTCDFLFGIDGQKNAISIDKEKLEKHSGRASLTFFNYLVADEEENKKCGVGITLNSVQLYL